MSGPNGVSPAVRLKDEVRAFGGALVHRGSESVEDGMRGLTHKLSSVAHVTAHATAHPAETTEPVRDAVGHAAGAARDKVAGVAGSVRPHLHRPSMPGKPSMPSKPSPPGKSSAARKPARKPNATKAAAGKDTTAGSHARDEIEHVDVPLLRKVAYRRWSDTDTLPASLTHGEPEATVVEDVPNERIVWTSSAKRTQVDGAVTFHELAPDLTRVLVTLEYRPDGLLSRIDNARRARGRRLRRELDHFRGQVTTEALLHPDESTPRKRTARKSTARKSTARKSTAARSTPRKTSTSRATPKKSTASGTTARKSTASKSTASKSTASKSTPRKSTPRKSTAKKTAASRR